VIGKVTDTWERVRDGAPLNPKDLAGRSKPQLALMPVRAMEPVARVMELGAAKYGAYNWRHVPIGLMAYLHALRRHLDAVIDNQDTDPESGAPHLAHVAATAMIVLDAAAAGTLVDDRPTRRGSAVGAAVKARHDLEATNHA